MISGANLIAIVERTVRMSLPPAYTASQFDAFMARWRSALIRVADEALEAALPPEPPAGEPEAWGAAARSRANLVAMRVLASLAPGALLRRSQRAALLGYSGWGGLSLDKVTAQLPEGIPAPERRGLIHEYYTPKQVWRDIGLHLVAALEGRREVHVLEPSAGIGRAVAAHAGLPGARRWQLVEASAVSARLLRALWERGSDRVYHGFFEAFVAGLPAETRYDVVLANPPYGPRGEAAEQDQDPRYAGIKRAALYFLFRALDLLEPGGIGVFIIPTGWLTGRSAEMRNARRRVLLGHHLAEAFRCPSALPPGQEGLVVYDQFVVDILIFQRRAAPLADVPAEDNAILDGRYFEAHPTHLLGRVLGEEGDWEPGMPKPRRGYQVEGSWRGLPAWSPRPMATGVAAAPVEDRPVVRQRGGIARVDVDVDLSAASPQVVSAAALGRRLDAYLTGVAAEDPAAAAAHGELVRDLEAWRTRHGDPRMDAELRALAERRDVGAQRFLAVWTPAGLSPAMRAQPLIKSSYAGRQATLADYAAWLYRQRVGQLPIAELLASYRASTGVAVDATRAIELLVRGGWCLDGERWDQLHPAESYYTGLLWPRHDRAMARRDDPVAQAQAKTLRERIGWRAGAAILQETLPIDSWLPLPLVEAFLAHLDIGRSSLERADGLLKPKATAYERLDNTDKRRTPPYTRDWLSFLGWANYDLGLWNPEREKVLDPETGEERREPVADARRKQEAAWTKAWQEWVGESEERLGVLEQHYNRELRGYIEPKWPTDVIPVARWSPAITPHDYQWAATHKLITNRCGLLAFDVGLGKTYTGLLTLALARQQGWAKRPVVVVPNSIIWKWHRDFARALPDYRVVVIGAERTLQTRGSRKGKWVSTPDTPEQRARKWSDFQAGAYDVALLTYSALARTQIDPGMVERYVNKTVALRRSITMSLDALDAGEADAKASKRPTERAAVDKEERVRQWVADKVSPPKGWVYDPGIDWHRLGIDFLLVDEAQNFKNLFFSEREGSADRAASKRSWALDFRCASVREHTGGTGVFLLSATPAKNAAVEFFTLLYLVNPAIWNQVAVDNPESFLTHFAQFERQQVQDAAGQKLVWRDVVTKFKNTDELREVIYRWATFKVAEDVGLKLPAVQVQQHQVDVTEQQQEILATTYTELADIEDSITNVARKAARDPEAQQLLQRLFMKRMGVAQRIYLLYLHPDLPGIGSNAAAIAKIEPDHGPKLIECANTIRATAERVCVAGEESFCLDCGHIVFCDNIAVHAWMKRALVARGIAADRIAVLNAVEVPDTEARQQIVEAFNGVGAPSDAEYQAPSVDVVIANAVAYEGMDLQRRTCHIHHLDVPWEPATLQQRNGRGVRQGNLSANVTIHFYFVKGSNEAWKVQRIERKRGWMASLVEGQARRTNTTTEVEVSTDGLSEEALEEVSLAHAPPDVKERLQRARKQQQGDMAEVKKASAQRQANKELRQVAALWRGVRAERDPERQAMKRAQAEAALASLGRFRDLWPFDWQAQAARVRLEEPYIPERGPALYAGDRITVQGVLAEVGRVAPHEVNKTGKGWVNVPGVWVRRDGQLDHAHWSDEQDLMAEDVKLGLQVSWPEEETLQKRANDSWGPRLATLSWSNAGWRRLAPATQNRLWPELFAWASSHPLDEWKRLTEKLIPLNEGGRLVLSTRLSGGVIPPTEEGWAQFVELGRQSGETWSDLAEVAAHWWGGRRYPKGQQVDAVAAAAA